MPTHQIIFLILSFTAYGYAAVRGGAPERIAAAAMFSAVIATWTLSYLGPRGPGAYASVEVGVALTDFTLFGIMVTVAMLSARFWPMLMASILGCGLFGHLTKPLGPDILPKAYYATVALWSYPTLLLLVIATWRHSSRLKRYGIDYPWVHTLPRRYRDGWSVNELARPLA